jgi:putative membrane protein
MSRFFLPLLGAALFALPACNSKTDTKGQGFSETTKPGTATEVPAATMPEGAEKPADLPNATGSAPAKGRPDPYGPTAPHANDAEFMQSAAHSDQNEIQLSKMALAKGVTGDTKAFAEKMLADHAKSTAALQPIAAKAGVTLPTDMDANHQKMAPTLQSLSGKAFEDRYLQQMEADHQITANTLAAHQQMTKNPALSAWIASTLPVVTEHLGMARSDARMKM